MSIAFIIKITQTKFADNNGICTKGHAVKAPDMSCVPIIATVQSILGRGVGITRVFQRKVI